MNDLWPGRPPNPNAPTHYEDPLPSPRVRLRLPRALLDYWSGPSSIEVAASTLAEAIGAVEHQAPGIGARILDDQGHVRRHVAIVVNNQRVDVDDPSTVTLKEGDVVHVVPAVSGG